MEIGLVQRLHIVDEDAGGWILRGDDPQGATAQLARGEAPDARAGSALQVFVHTDAGGRPIATTQRPHALRGECAALTVAEVDDLGAWLDWGLPKQLFLPHAEQRRRLRVGQREIVTVRLDRRGRLVASARLDTHLDERPDYLSPRQQVRLLPYQRTDLGIKAVIEHRAIGLLYRDEVYRDVPLGQACTGWVRRIREDGRIDLAMQPPRGTDDDALCDAILSHLGTRDGRSELTDRSSPEAIREVFGVSKKHFKRALARLYRDRRIVIADTEVRLAEPDRS